MWGRDPADCEDVRRVFDREVLMGSGWGSDCVFPPRVKPTTDVWPGLLMCRGVGLPTEEGLCCDLLLS